MADPKRQHKRGRPPGRQRQDTQRGRPSDFRGREPRRSEPLIVTPKKWTPRGEVMAWHRGKPLLVWQGIPGEPAEVHIQNRGQNQLSGYWVDSPQPHTTRTLPPCERFVACGGCPIMHVNVAGQEDARRMLVRAALDEEDLSSVKIGSFTPCPVGLADFRHVVKIGTGYSDQGHIRLGAWGRRSRRIVPIPRCPVAAPILRRAMASLAHHVIDLEIRPYDSESDSGILRCAILRSSYAYDQLMVTLVVARRIRPLQDLAERLARDVNHVVGVWAHVNRDPGNAIFSRDEEGDIGLSALLGQSALEDRLNGIEYRVGPADFFQTNPAVAELLYRRTMERLVLQRGLPVVDLYCGVGGFALQAAKKTDWVIGIEEVRGAVVRAREAAKKNGLEARFLAGRVSDVLPDLKRQLAEHRPVVVVNPARRGLEEGVVDALLALRPRQVAYISCNPRAMARDLALLKQGGLEVGEVELFDMFPNTPHVECLVTLSASDAQDLAMPSTERRARRRVVRR